MQPVQAVPSLKDNKSPIYKKKSIDVSPIFKRNSQVTSSYTGLNILSVINSVSPQSGSNLNTKRSEQQNVLKKRVEKPETTDKVNKIIQNISKVFFYFKLPITYII